MSTPAEIAEKARQEAVPPEQLRDGTATGQPELETDPEVKKTVTENQQVFFLLTKTIADQVKRDLEDRQDKSNAAKLTMFGIIFGIVTAIGSLLGYTFIDRSVDAAFKERLDAQLEQVSLVSDLALISANAEAMKDTVFETEHSELEALELIDRVASFNNRFVVNVPTNAEGIALVSDQYANSSRLLRATEPLMEVFAQAGRDDLVIRLYSAAPTVMERSTSVLQDVIHSLGRTLLSLPEGADAWSDEDGSAREMYQAYRSFADRAEFMGFPELYLLFELNFRHMAGAADDEMIALIDKTFDLNEVDESLFVSHMTDLLNEDWRYESDAETRLVSTRVSAFLDDWAPASDTLMEVKENEN